MLCGLFDWHQILHLGGLMKKLAALFLALGFYSPSTYAAIACTGNVSLLALSPGNGIVQVSNGFGVWYLCSVSSVVNGVPTESCKAVYSTLLAAQASGRTMTMDFDTTAQCSQLGNWAVPNPIPYYMQINN